MTMDNIYKAQDFIKNFVSKSILPKYKFSDWKDALVLSRNGKKDELLDKWNFYNKSFAPTWIEPDIIANGDWVPALMCTYRWTIKNAEIPVRFTIVNNEIQYVEIVSMFDVAKHFGEDFDFVNEFDKSVAMLYNIANP